MSRRAHGRAEAAPLEDGAGLVEPVTKRLPRGFLTGEGVQQDKRVATGMINLAVDIGHVAVESSSGLKG